MSRARILADYVSSGDELADKAPLASPTFTGTATFSGDIVPSTPLSHRNMIINGGFDVWQRGTSFTADNVFTADRWKSTDGSGGSPARTASREVFTLGQTDVPDAHYYFRHNQTGASTNGNSSLVTNIEDVTKTAGKTLTLSFYAKANSSMTIGLRFIQAFGTGGSPSASVEITETTVTIGTSWAKHTATVTMPSMSGKTIGTDGVHTSSTILNIDFNPTGTFTFEIARLQLELGSSETPFEHRSYGDELAKCRRYYQRFGDANYMGLSAGVQGSAITTKCFFIFPVEMCKPPTISYSDLIITERTNYDLAVSSFSGSNISTDCAYLSIGHASGGAHYYAAILSTTHSNAGWLAFTAEL